MVPAPPHKAGAPTESGEHEVRELRRLLRDLVALATTPATWVGRDPGDIARGVADILLHTLRAEAVYVASGKRQMEGLREGSYPGFKAEVIRLRSSSGANSMLVQDVTAPQWRSGLRLAIHPIGLSAEDAYVAVGSSRANFPTEGESLLLSVAANQAAISIQTARLRMKAEFERRHLEELLAQAPAAIALMQGPEHRYTYVNEEYVRVTGRSSAADFIGRTIGESLPELEHQFLDLLDGVYRSGEAYVGHEVRTTLHRAGSGQTTEAYFDFVYQPVKDADNSVDGILVHAIEVTDKVLARHQLEENESRLRAIIETTPECVKLVAGDGTLLHMNAAGISMVGASCGEEVLGKNIYDVIAPEHRERFREFNESVCTGRRGTLEFEIVGLTGVRRYMETHAAPLRLKEGPSVQLAVTRDVTERKTAAEALRQSEEQFRALANTVPHLVWMANPDGWIFWYNQQWYDYTGRTPHEMEGWGWQSVHDPKVLPSVVRKWKSSIETAQPFEMTFPLRGRDGLYRQFLTRVAPVKDRDGAVRLWFGTNTDVSKEIEVQDRLQSALVASQRLAAIVESSTDAIISKDLQGVVTSWNPAAERMFGYTAAEMVGRPIRTIIPAEIQSQEDEILMTVACGERIEHYETLRLTKEGKTLEVSLTVSPIRDESGRVIGAAKIARDITERKKTERTLRTTERLASVGRLAATVAHEINNPLEAVTNLVYLAKSRANRDDVTRFLSSAEEELERVSHLTKQTLGFYRETKAPTRVKLGEIVASSAAVFSGRLRNKSIRLSQEILDDVEIFAVPGEIRQLIANLLSNSIDAVEAGGWIRIRVRAASSGKRSTRLTVADSGPGIPASIRPHLFEPFFTTKKDVGTGLGLWVCKSIIDNHKGSIRIKSSTEPGRSWTAICVFLPSAAEQELDLEQTLSVGRSAQ